MIPAVETASALTSQQVHDDLLDASSECWPSKASRSILVSRELEFAKISRRQHLLQPHAVFWFGQLGPIKAWLFSRSIDFCSVAHFRVSNAKPLRLYIGRWFASS